MADLIRGLEESPARIQASRWLKNLEAGEPIPRQMEKIHLGIKRVQFLRRELLDCLPLQGEVRAHESAPRAV